MLGLNAFDALMLVVMLAFAITGSLRGFVLEILSLILWPLAAFLAWFFSESAATFLSSTIADPQLRVVAAFVIVFLLIFVIGTIVVYFVHRALPLRGNWRTSNIILGGFIGFVRGGIIVVIAFLVAGITSMPQRPWWHESALAPYFQKVAIVVSDYLPRDISQHIRFS
ncbi:MAG: CvpA family protein [Gammaproteobacteria bacterium]|nr:CvpA family protein [Gammaproteobacteria bacterium]